MDARECAYALGEGEDFRVVTYFGWESTEDGGAYGGAFATNFEVTDAGRALAVAVLGRRGWNIARGNGEIEFSQEACLEVNVAAVRVAGKAVYWLPEGPKLVS